MMNNINIIKRDAQIYKDIESFRDYEFTYCCIFEMAIRSSWYASEVKKLIEMYKKLYPFPIITTKQQWEVAQSALKGYSITSPSPLVDKFRNLGISKGTLKFLENHVVNHKEIMDIYSRLSKESTPKKEINGGIEIKERGVSLSHYQKTYITRQIDRKCYSIKNKFEIDDPLLSECISPGFYTGEKGFDKAKEVLQPILEKNRLHDIKLDTTIYPKMSRPMLKFKSLEDRQVSLSLNFALPKYQLVDYIERIKDDLDSQEWLTPSPMDLFGEELSELLTLEQLEHKKGSKQITMATMFYIYDAFKLGMKQSQIKLNISYYNDVNIDERTIKKYHAVMKKYIDCELFKNLLI